MKMFLRTCGAIGMLLINPLGSLRSMGNKAVSSMARKEALQPLPSPEIETTQSPLAFLECGLLQVDARPIVIADVRTVVQQTVDSTIVAPSSTHFHQHIKTPVSMRPRTASAGSGFGTACLPGITTKRRQAVFIFYFFTNKRTN